MTEAGQRYCTQCGSPVDESGRCPVHDAAAPRDRRPLLVAAAAALLAAGLIAGLLVLRAEQRDDNRKLRAELAEADQVLEAAQAATNGLSRRLGDLETRINAQPDPAAVARTASASVYTVEAGDSVGSSFVIGSTPESSSLVTNFHVVEEEWDAGRRRVKLRQEGKELDGVIDRVSEVNDVAVLTVASSLPALPKATNQPSVGDSVLVIGAPLGLGGSVSNGIVSAFRDGFIQFSAPIAPGNSGGPLVNLQGQVIGVARSKLVATGAEGLSFAIPISLVCTTVSVC